MNCRPQSSMVPNLIFFFSHFFVSVNMSRRSALRWLVFWLTSLIPTSLSISLSCYKPNSVPTNLYQHYGDIMVDCSLHGFGSREDLFFHKSDLCRTTPTLCDLITGFDYSYNAIRHLGKPRYEFPLINKLYFQHNYISVVEDDAFGGGNLRFLDLTHNKITGKRPATHYQVHLIRST